MLSNNLEMSNKDNLAVDNDSTTNQTSAVLKTKINIDSLDIVNIKRETYYKMKFIINSLEKNWAIKKRNTIFYLKNLEDSTTEIITEDYLNKRIVNKIYSHKTNIGKEDDIHNDNNNTLHKSHNNLETMKRKEKVFFWNFSFPWDAGGGKINNEKSPLSISFCEIFLMPIPAYSFFFWHCPSAYNIPTIYICTHEYIYCTCSHCIHVQESSSRVLSFVYI